MKILLVRHGATAFNKQKRYLGRTDVPIEADQVPVLERLSKRVVALQPGRCYCSPLQRTRQTAQILLKDTEISIEFDDRLQEIDFGKWDGMTFSEICAAHPDSVKEWTDHPEQFVFPDGESVASFRSRIEGVAGEFSKKNDETVLVVSHGGVIRALLCHFLKLSLENYFKFEIRPACMTIVELHGENAVLQGLNLG